MSRKFVGGFGTLGPYEQQQHGRFDDWGAQQPFQQQQQQHVHLSTHTQSVSQDQGYQSGSNGNRQHQQQQGQPQQQGHKQRFESILQSQRHNELLDALEMVTQDVKLQANVLSKLAQTVTALSENVQEMRAEMSAMRTLILEKSSSDAPPSLATLTSVHSTLPTTMEHQQHQHQQHQQSAEHNQREASSQVFSSPISSSYHHQQHHQQQEANISVSGTGGVRPLPSQQQAAFQPSQPSQAFKQQQQHQRHQQSSTHSAVLTKSVQSVQTAHQRDNEETQDTRPVAARDTSDDEEEDIPSYLRRRGLLGKRSYTSAFWETQLEDEEGAHGDDFFMSCTDNKSTRRPAPLLHVAQPVATPRRDRYSSQPFAQPFAQSQSQSQSAHSNHAVESGPWVSRDDSLNEFSWSRPFK